MKVIDKRKKIGEKKELKRDWVVKESKSKDQNETGVEKKIKCFVLASGASVITEYEERDAASVVAVGEEYEKELYWINPMLSDYQRLQTGQVGIGMSPLSIFSKEDVVGPINIFTIITSYEISLGLQNSYEAQVVKLKTARSGLVQATKMPQPPKIGGGGGMKILKG